MAIRVPNPAVQHFNIKTPKAPLSGGRMFFFEPDSAIKKDTFTDAAAGTANANPVILDAAGLEPDIFGEGSYRIVLESSIADGSLQQWVRDPIDLGAGGGAFADWLSTVDYGIGGINIVTGSDGIYYKSIQTPNLNNDPTTSVLFWRQFSLLFRGASVHSDSVKAQALTSLAVIDLWEAEDYDTDNIWAPTPNPTRLTTPLTATKVRIDAMLTATIEPSPTPTSGSVFFNIFKNGDTTASNLNVSVSITRGFDTMRASTRYYFSTSVLAVTGGDYFELYGNNGTDGDVSVQGGIGAAPGNGFSYFAMQVIE